MSTTETNKDIVCKYIDLMFTVGDPDAADAYIAPDFVNHDPVMGQPGTRDGMKNVSRNIRAAFPDWHAAPFLLVAEDDLVVELFTATGHHTGEAAMGVEPSGRSVTLQGINVFRVRDGQIVERWGRLDDLGFQAQVGVAGHTIPA